MGGQNSKMLNFEPIRHMRGLFALFSGAELDGNVKTLIFGVLGGQGVISGTPRGSYVGQNSKILNFEPIRHMRGAFASFSDTGFNFQVKTLIFDL